MEYTGERMIPEVNKGWLTYSDHYARYLALREIVKGKNVLDVACGSGFGTQMLAETALHVDGVDIDKETIDYAQKNFSGKNIKYSVGSAYEIPARDKSYDVVVSFETVEHLDNHPVFYNEVKRVLKPSGILIVSMPNAKNPLHGTNEFHVSEQNLDEFEKELKSFFKNVDISFQNIWITSQIWPKHVYSSTEKESKVETLNYKPFKSDPDKALVFIGIASDKVLDHKIPAVVVPSSENILEMIKTLQNYKELDEQLNKRIDAMEDYISQLKSKLGEE
jgi:ubiquinone/menaquinone biosynthesis C-methylase UbiE